jgi:hypothetical protein
MNCGRHLCCQVPSAGVSPSFDRNWVAVRMGRTDPGESRWCVTHAWGTGTFYGTA